jgi:hypothetical protein
MPPKLGPRSQEEILLLLQRTMMSGQDIKALFRFEGFPECDSRNAQL